MNRRQISWYVAMAVLTLVVAATAPAFPQDSGTASQGQAPPVPEVTQEAVEKRRCHPARA